LLLGVGLGLRMMRFGFGLGVGFDFVGDHLRALFSVGDALLAFVAGTGQFGLARFSAAAMACLPWSAAARPSAIAWHAHRARPSSGGHTNFIEKTRPG
jgi:hypothetical protein